MNYPYNYNPNFIDPNNWQVNNPAFSNPTNIPYFVHSPNIQNPITYFPINSDPRFKPTVSCDNPTLLHSESIDKKTDDELWIETYLSKIGKININLHSNIEIISQKPTVKVTNTNKKSLKIHVARSVLHRCIKLLEHLEKLETNLRENVATITSAEWKQKTVEIGQQKDEFTALLSQFDNSSVLEQLHGNLNKRKRKRIIEKQRKINAQKLYAERLKKRELAHKNIDKWLEMKKDDVERSKREENLKKDADCVLSEVTKKKSDARKQLSLLSALIKLRSVREKAAIAHGEKINHEDSSAFKQNTEKLQKMWENAMSTYCLEEQGLKVMLENNVANEVHTVCPEEKRVLNEWDIILFGPKIIPCDAYWGLTCAEKDLGTFIAIRKSWDTFLVPNDNKEGSRIPIGWILPETDLTSWKH